MKQTETALSLGDLASLLGISKTRAHQLADAGVLVKRGRGFDPLQSALACIGYLRRDEETKQARLRMLRATAAGHERRLRRQLRHLLTVAELRELFATLFDSLWKLNQAEASRFHSTLASRLPDDEARRAAYVVYEANRLYCLGVRNGLADLARRIDAEVLPADARLEAVFDEIMASVMPDDDSHDDDAEDEPTDGPRDPKVDAALRKARSAWAP
jgi:hypothetical protein